jgi:LysR family transcriptional regulator, nitrogen assimilation regulatory protein
MRKRSGDGDAGASGLLDTKMNRRSLYLCLWSISVGELGRGVTSLNFKNNPVLDLRQLCYFLALAEHGSISAAAAALSMAQPSLSENIAKLESKLEVKLAIRGARGIQLTEAGMALAKRGGEIVSSVDSLVEEIRQLGGEPRGPVSVGIPPSLSILLSVPLLETIHSEHPLVRLHIAEAMSGDILDWINTDRVDVGCVYEVSDSGPYSFEPLLTEELFLVTAPDNWPGPIGPDGVALSPISASRLQELPLVLTSTTHGARKLQEKFSRSIGIRLNVVAEIDSLPHIVEMVSRASAYTLLSHGAVINQVASGSLALVPIEEPTIRRTAYIVRKRARPVTRASVIVEACVQSIVREMVHRYKLKAILPNAGKLAPAADAEA